MNIQYFAENRYNKIINAIERLEVLNCENIEIQTALTKQFDPSLQLRNLKNHEELENCHTQLSSCFYKNFSLLERLSDTIWDLPEKYKLYTKYSQLKSENGRLIGIKTIAELEELRDMLKAQYPMHITLIDSVYSSQIEDTRLIEKYINQKKLSR